MQGLFADTQGSFAEINREMRARRCRLVVYVRLMWRYRASLRIYTALLQRYRALLRIYRALLQKYAVKRTHHAPVL